MLEAKMTNGTTALCLKHPLRVKVVDNFFCISFLRLICKLLTGVIADKMYVYLDGEDLLPNQFKGYHQGNQGSNDQLLIDKVVLSNCEKININLAVACIDYTKAYDLLFESWIGKCQEMFGAPENITNLLTDNMKNEKLGLATNVEVFSVEEDGYTSRGYLLSTYFCFMHDFHDFNIKEG